MIEVMLEKESYCAWRTSYKPAVVFVDDVNMTVKSMVQPPVELLRQFADFKGFFDREKQIERHC